MAYIVRLTQLSKNRHRAFGPYYSARAGRAVGLFAQAVSAFEEDIDVEIIRCEVQHNDNDGDEEIHFLVDEKGTCYIDDFKPTGNPPLYSPIVLIDYLNQCVDCFCLRVGVDESELLTHADELSVAEELAVYPKNDRRVSKILKEKGAQTTYTLAELFK